MYDHTLSVIIATFNEAEHLEETLRSVDLAIMNSSWNSCEIIVVNDGSTDQTLELLNSIELSTPLKTITHENKGRFLSRSIGIDIAKGEYCLLLDSRVRPEPDSLQYVAKRLTNEPSARVWNGDIDQIPQNSLVVGFWKCILFSMWRRYFKKREELCYSFEEYDYFPKGTGFFLAPRLALKNACDAFNSLYSDVSLASDDTHLIRPISRQFDIWIGPNFKASYLSRTSLRKFAQHSFFRGTTFVDGFLRKGSRFFIPLLLLIPTSIIVGIAFIIQPVLITFTSLIVLLLASALFLRNGVRKRDLVGFWICLPIFVPSYFLGIFRGLLLARRV